MVGTQIIIKFKGEYVSLFDGHRIKINHLFANDLFMRELTCENECHLGVRINSLSGKNLSIKIESYNIGAGHFESFQTDNKELLANVQKIHLSGGSNTMQILAMGLKSTHRIKHKTHEVPRQKSIEKPTENKVDVSNEIDIHEITERQLSLKVKYPIEKLIFNKGNVSFSLKAVDLNKTIEVNINNDFITATHDSIKPYFRNILKTTEINVTVSIEYSERSMPGTYPQKEITKIESKSEEIDRITPDLIEKVKLFYLDSRKGKIIASEHSLLNKEDYLKLYEQELDIKDLFDSDISLFKALIEVTNTKHHQHLLFLSKMHEFETMRLRFIPKPISFMFLLKGIKNHYFIWETSDTKEATYIWSIPKNDLVDLKKRTQ